MTTKFYYDKELPPPTVERLKYTRAQVIRLRQEPQPVQRSKEWYELRDQMLTASDWGAIEGVSPYKSPTDVLLGKCGRGKPFPNNSAILHGVKHEDSAIKIYEKRNETKVIEFGVLQHKIHKFLGASPDGITADGIMVEIKCPSSRKITGIAPAYYERQVQAQLEVCELDRCDFLECKIVEYDSGNDYYSDNFEGDYTKNSLGLEKGVIMEFLDNITREFAFYHSDVGLTQLEVKEWADGIRDEILEKNPNYIYAGFSYWGLHQISCIPIYRNQTWFHNTLPMLADFWQKVCYHREHGTEEIEKQIADEKQRKREEREKKRMLKRNAMEAKKRKKDNNKIFIDTYIDDFSGKKPKLDVPAINEQTNFMIQNKESLFSDGSGVKSIYNAEEIDLTEHEVFTNSFQESIVGDVTEKFSNCSFSSKTHDYSPVRFGDIKGFDINLDDHEVFKME